MEGMYASGLRQKALVTSLQDKISEAFGLSSSDLPSQSSDLEVAAAGVFPLSLWRTRVGNQALGP